MVISPFLQELRQHFVDPLKFAQEHEGKGRGSKQPPLRGNYSILHRNAPKIRRSTLPPETAQFQGEKAATAMEGEGGMIGN